MTRPLIPPRGVFVSSRLLFHPSMNAALKDTLIQMMGLTWGNKARMTPLLTYPLLEQLTRKSARRLYGHLTVLRKTYSVLELQSAGNGTFVLVLADWLFEPPRQGYNFKQKPVKEEEESLDESRLEIPPPDSSDQEEGSGEKPRQIEKFGKRKPSHKSMRNLSPALREKLLAVGVFPSLLDEVADSPYSEADLDAFWPGRSKTNLSAQPDVLFSACAITPSCQKPTSSQPALTAASTAASMSPIAAGATCPTTTPISWSIDDPPAFPA